MIHSFPAEAMFSTVLHDCRRGNEHALDDEYDQVLRVVADVSPVKSTVS